MTQPNKPEVKSNKSSRELEVEVIETRNALAGDIQALGDKVSPAHLKQQAKNAMEDVKDAAVEKVVEVKDAALEIKDVAVEKVIEVKDAAVDKAIEVKDAAVDKAHQVADSVAETMDEVGDQTLRAGKAAWSFTVANAVPLGLVGIGAGWMIANQRRERTPRAMSQGSQGSALKRSGGADLDYDSGDGLYASGPVRQRGPSSKRSARAAGDNGFERSGEPARSLSDGDESSRSLYQKASQSLGQSKDKLAAGASRGRDVVQEKLARAGRASREFAGANPLLTVFGTLALGVGVGMLLPSTARENQLLGPSREKFKRMIDDARDAARDVGAVAKETAKETLATVEGSAQ